MVSFQMKISKPYLKGGKCKYVFKTLKDQQIADSLSRYVQEENIDLAVMLTRNRSFWQNLLIVVLPEEWHC
ncbi:MAG: hypothetical protein R2769_05850 [Saprospiraceae bacterium]